MFSYPLVAISQQNSIHTKAIADAERDAEANVNKSLWFFGGCLGGILVIIFANVHEPSPPAVAFLGKSPEYISFYTDAYRSKARNLQTSQAIKGCAANGIAIAGCYGCLFLNIVLEETYYY